MSDGVCGAGYFALPGAGVADVSLHPTEALPVSDALLGAELHRRLRPQQHGQWRSPSTTLMVVGAIIAVVDAIVLLGS